MVWYPLLNHFPEKLLKIFTHQQAVYENVYLTIFFSNCFQSSNWKIVTQCILFYFIVLSYMYSHLLLISKLSFLIFYYFSSEILLLIFKSLKHVKAYHILSDIYAPNIFPVCQFCFKFGITDFRSHYVAFDFVLLLSSLFLQWLYTYKISFPS
jgi:hypothetical protein